MSNQCYFNGDFYQCVTATTAGQSPTTTATSWRKIALPNKWRWVLAQLTYANLLRLDGQTDKATVAMSIAYGRERTGLDELVRQEANEEGHRGCHRGREARVNTGRTRPVKASVILDDAYRLIGWDADQLDDREKQDARAALSQAVQEVWEAWWWQELMTCAPTPVARPLAMGEVLGAFADNYNIAYWPLTDRCYICVGDVNTVDPTDSAGVMNEENWVELDYSPEYAAWSPTTTYEQFEKVSWNGKNWAMVGNPTLLGEEPAAGGSWYELPQPWPIIPYRDNTYTAPPATTTVGLVGPFGPIRSVSKFDPRTSANPQHFELDVTEDGTRVIGLTVGRPWVWARRVTPVIEGDEFDATETYEATEPEDLVYDA